MELYKKYRPKTLSEMVGNKTVLRSVYKMVKAGKVPQVILFHGPSGCGKTTLARILQGVLECDAMDRGELNASSTRGIDSIRELAQLATLTPMKKSKVWILDEVHQWLTATQNATLKLLEDTPPNVYFFLCTTDPQKLIKAVRTRCTEIPLQTLTRQHLTDLLDRVNEGEKLDLTEEQYDLLLDHSSGSARTLLVLLDRLQHLDPEEWDLAVAKGDDDPQAIDLCRALLNGKDWATIRGILKGLTGDIETARWTVLGFAAAVLLKSDNPKAFAMIQSFSSPFFDNKKAGLVGSAYEVYLGG